MGSVHAKPRSSTLMKKQQYRTSRSRSHSSLVSVIRGIMLALAASALPFLITYTLPSLKIFLFEFIPSFWRCSCALFTPKILFVLLNLIILTIFALAHLHSTQSASTASSLLQPPPSCDYCAAPATSEDGDCAAPASSEDGRAVSEPFIKLDDKNPADLQLVESTTYAQINDHRLTNHGTYKDDDRDNQDMNTGLMVTKEMIMLQGVDNGEQCADRQMDKRKAESESKKAEKAKGRCGVAAAESKKAEKATAEGNPGNKFYNIDSLLSEEGSIFTLLQSRPLPSARFSHKKPTKLSGLDRPLSPLKMSRPILKRGDTLDATWKAICESKRHSSPLNRHYSKHSRKVDPSEEIIDTIVNKPRVSSSSPLSPIKQRTKIIMNSLHDKELSKTSRREPSMPQEELNAKVESFISRFNEQIRIQREKSLLDYMEMVGRGSS